MRIFSELFSGRLKLCVMALGMFQALQFNSCNVFGTRILYPSKLLSMHTSE